MASKPIDTENERQDHRNCPNCYYPLPRFGNYCSHCGQKYTDGKVTVGSLIRHFLADSLNLDAKIWRTLAALLVPGKLTIAFFKGRQQRFIRPLRLFFIFAVITIASATFFEAEFTEGLFEGIEDDFSSGIHYSLFLDQLDTATVDLKTRLPETTHPALDSLKKEMKTNHSDSIGIGVKIIWNEEEQTIDNFQIAKKDIAELTIDSLLEKYEVTGFSNRLLLRQSIKLQKQGENFAAFILNQTIWMMLLIMPILAVFLKLLYVRRSYYYVEHLIFSFHVHALLFLVLTILMLLDNYPAISDQMGVIWGVGFIAMELYFYKALRKVYQQSRFKTILKFLILNLCYLVLFFTALLLTILVAALLF